MIGNDIVDLKQAALESNWQRPRFLDKVYTKKEQQLIFSAENQHQMVWLLWSMKEAAYKVNVQQFAKRFFNPKRIECELVSLEKGVVTINNEIYYTTSIINDEFVYSVATLNQENNYKTAYFKTKIEHYKIQSEALKIKFLKTISKSNKLNFNVLNIKKSKSGIPEVYDNFNNINIEFSLTHCGRFSSFVYM